MKFANFLALFDSEALTVSDSLLPGLFPKFHTVIPPGPARPLNLMSPCFSRRAAAPAVAGTLRGSGSKFEPRRYRTVTGWHATQ
eukprot:217586-Hanusia_phi.AAC.2